MQSPNIAVPLPPRRVRIVWSSILGPNFGYFFHVIMLSLIPAVTLVWLLVFVAWLTLGTQVDGRYYYYIGVVDGKMNEESYIEFRTDPAGADERIAVGHMAYRERKLLGMPDVMHSEPGKPAFETVVPVRVLRFPGFVHAEAIFPWTSYGPRLIVPLLIAAIATVIIAYFHGELFRTIARSRWLVRHGHATQGTFTQFHETGWWEYHDYSRSYVRRVYADYSFRDPVNGVERRGCQLVLGPRDPARMAAGSQVVVLYDPNDPATHGVCDFMTFRWKP